MTEDHFVSPYPLAVVEYVDSALQAEQTNRVAKPFAVTTVGFVIHEDDDALTLCAELVGEDYRGQVSIPKVAVTRREEISTR